MARALRFHYREAVYHVTTRGNRREDIFLSDRDRRKFLFKLNETITKYSLVIYAYCLMPNHYHLFLRTPEANLSESMHYFNSSYAIWYKVRHKLIGPLFQGRFHSILVEEEAYALNLSMYIHLNPWRWKLVDRPEKYAWSSCAHYLGLRRSPLQNLDADRILAYFGRDLQGARAEYKRQLYERMKKGMSNPMKAAYRASILGGPAFVDRMKETVKANPPGREQAKGILEEACAISPASVFETISRIGGCEVREILARKRLSIWRPLGIFLVKRYCGLKIREIAAIWGMDYAAASQAATRFERRIDVDAKTRQLLEKIDLGVRSQHSTFAEILLHRPGNLNERERRTAPHEKPAKGEMSNVET